MKPEQLGVGQGDGQVGAAVSVRGEVDERAVAELHQVVLSSSVRCHRIETLVSGGARSVDADGDRVEQLGVVMAAAMPEADDAGRRGSHRPELVGAHQEAVAPGGVLGAVAEPGQDLGEHLAGLGSSGAAKTAWLASSAANRRSPSSANSRAFAAVVGDSAERVDVALRPCFGRVLPQVRGVAVVPPEVALVDRLDVVADRPVVAVGVPGRRRVRVASRSSRRSRRRCSPG